MSHTPSSEQANPSRIVLPGASGYTGRVLATALVSRGLEPVLLRPTPWSQPRAESVKRADWRVDKAW